MLYRLLCRYVNYSRPEGKFPRKIYICEMLDMKKKTGSVKQKQPQNHLRLPFLAKII